MKLLWRGHKIFQWRWPEKVFSGLKQTINYRIAFLVITILDNESGRHYSVNLFPRMIKFEWCRKWTKAYTQRSNGRIIERKKRMPNQPIEIAVFEA